ncbi:hypothetical protein GCM10010495_21600 [Kitasatospora herbaricolor]|uniref:hypothetical protein n=1 Tax=Kitasatospora herbaricolor TaxID=68217 RepID=UPI00198E09F7|nr:hypothetical protein [Kitasatospora herbaricolor]MDQ0310640.1 hypothetical protein [Kitasatospora herbaricolor]GGV08574.1 hypothetical protein GCM10010495_21600 [Kitasatospora herbaricolor]
MRSLAFLLLTAAVMAVLVLLLRWTYGGGSSLVERRPRTGRPDEYGLLVAVAAPPDAEQARRLAARLDAAGLRHTLVRTAEGPRLMVWPADAEAARHLLRRG